ncbi:1-acyl-sn-glycerol-3-phosphate acyltransferase [Nocardioides sp. STR2]|uniref:1-acyl-sn-glycerol-3-phosphate acyltransferase n=1 Tax=Nocardioides pini TaxID=2975053 RepID=A0ABT4CAB8_9ACTN|nr:1-acyl-sn-glycerol-3-phosphate acyltransferase [Nocardioides pini]MCY4724827.1 1-acyl-sn-glycerol-3-phosphate acyltransferase [Nocardioides pini]
MREEARRPRGDDAVVIPIGTGGRPGRGTGSARPSSAARNLAPSARKASARKASAGKAGARKAGSKPRDAAGPTAAPSGEESAPPPPDETSTDGSAQAPTTGIPVGEWLAAAQDAAQEVFGADWERRVAELMAFVRRRLEGHYEVDDYGFDRELTERFFMTALRPIAEKWFRLEVRGLENIPAEGGALVVSNHSGTVPVDGLMTMLTVHDHAGRSLRPLGADLVFKLPLVSSLARKSGATLACTEDAERMLSGGELVGVWPEGFKGIGKPFSERYKLQRFGRGGFVSAALRTGVPIIPLSVVGAEEIYPLVGNVPSLARLLGVPYIPITPFFPWLGPLGLVPLPSKWILEFGEPIRTDTYEPGEAEDPMLVFNVTDQVRETIQHTLFDLLRERGGVFG